ncbi:MAG: hypothetical protein IM597_07145 [Pseudanabaena sp. M176S2SP2A07QC]|nr:hypothetical protein [Pseudanabaena sp. M176S2SP2A07QC]MCA6540476.1 hypothetical protein [Pseudanabaena sp. M037S2SP2A07QC]MCA6567136.1 hypothetical protein [Pseudanabaena sp. M151S2SP2A07QC]MCA6579653.1 hypothetical protein [Pseudanabaena sp. M085S1SP2A07QC]
MAELRSAIFWVLNCPIYLLRCYISSLEWWQITPTSRKHVPLTWIR